MDKIHKFRRQIDQIDQKLRQLLQERQDVVSELKKIKKKDNIPTEDLGREEHILNLCKNEATKEVFREILKQSKKLQNDA